MKILLIQLSDMHLKAESNIVLSRIETLKNAVQSVDGQVAAYFVLMTGDVAYSGATEEYALAHRFFDELRAGLLAIRPSIRVEEVFIPGNHDCVLKPDSPVRTALLGVISQKEDEAPYRPDDSIIVECLKVQDNFFEFRSQRQEKSGNLEPPLAGVARLFYRHIFDLEDEQNKHYQLRFDCYNSAWMSQVHEQPGQLLVPLGLAGDEPVSEADVTGSLVHHPYGWLNPNNARAFRKEIEAVSDIVMTGHEHVSEQYQKRPLEGGVSEYFEGAVLQEGEQPQSGFNVLLLDLEKRERKIVLFEWEEGMYQPLRESEWQPFDRALKHNATRLENTREFASYLHDVGANFTHPSKPKLALEDVFVYPDFDERTYLREGSREMLLSTNVGGKMLDYVVKHPHVLFAGADLCGRTSLAKRLYVELQEKGFVPLLLDGKKFDSPKIQAFERLCKEAIRDQYGAEAVVRFSQVEPKHKVLVVDNFHSSKLNVRGQNSIAQLFEAVAEHVIVFVNDVWEFWDLARDEQECATLLKFKHCELREFGSQGRGRLIEKWFDLGREFTLDARDVVHRVKEAEHLVSILLGKSLLPAYPLFILTILQQYETHSNLDTASGSYGYYYEVLITTSLHNRSKNIPLDMLYPLLSRFAYRMFEKRQKSLTSDELEEVAHEYRNLYHVSFSSEEMRRVLEEAHMLHLNSDGHYAFPYKYIGYYFVARYIRDHLHTQEHEASLRTKIEEMTSKLYVQDYANIVIFLVYLTKDEKTITDIMQKAKGLFEECMPCDMTTSVSFINGLSGRPLPMQIPEGSEKEHRDQHRAASDEMKRTMQEHTPDGEVDLVETEDSEASVYEEKEWDDFLKFNVAVKTLQIMGQILRNFPGTLPGEMKVEIARESYLLGLRSLGRVYGIMEDNFTEFHALLSKALVEQLHLPTNTQEQREEAGRRVNNWVYNLMLAASYGFIKRISYAVGSEYLKETYKRVEDDRCSLSIDLINVSIKLDHFQSFPTDEVFHLHAKLENHLFTDTILRRMVCDYFYLYEADYKLRQRVCAKLDIQANIPKMLTPGNKKQ